MKEQLELLVKTGAVQLPENIEERFASAPYNFVSLPDKIVPSQLDQSLDWYHMEEKERINAYRNYILKYGNFSGRLELEITTETPCFIGGNGEDFYAPNGLPVIPGSTLRGFTKNLLKIISCGAMRRDEDFYDRHLYFRDFTSEAAAKHTLKDYYAGRMVKEVDVEIEQVDGTTVKIKKTRTQASPGFLFKHKDSYYICPTQAKVVYDPVKCNNYKKGKIIWNQDETVDIFTGEIETKKTYFYFEKPVFSLDEDKCIKVPLEVKEEYDADKGRKGFDLFKNGKRGNAASGYTHLEGVTFVVPCYYKTTVKDKEKVVEHFGHGRYYRIAYDRSIGDHVPEALNDNTIDFADAMFGKKELWGSRLFFDDAKLIDKKDSLGLNYRLPLLQPKPTSFQLYLQQENEKAIKHWGEDADIRGYKLYWHQAIGDTDWQHSLTKIDPSRLTERQRESLQKSLQKLGNITKKIRPLAKGSRFRGNIRFSNLSEVELGALCKVFCLAENKEEIVYKIGQGKPIGMGSVRITARLILEDSAARYASLFKADGWNNGENREEKQLKDYCKEFQRYLNQKLTGRNRTRYELGMKELRTILNWNQTKTRNWKEKTAMMNPTQRDTRLKDRVPLKDAISFVEESFKK